MHQGSANSSFWLTCVISLIVFPLYVYLRPPVISLPYVGLLPLELWDGIWNCPIGQPTVDRQLTLACAICQTHLLDSFQTITFQFRVVRLQGDNLLEYLKPIQCWETHMQEEQETDVCERQPSLRKLKSDSVLFDFASLVVAVLTHVGNWPSDFRTGSSVLD